MGAMDTATANAVLDWTLDASGGYAVGDVSIRLMRVMGTATTPGTQVTASAGYTSGGMVCSLNPASNRTKTLSALMSWPNMPTTDVVGIELWDDDTTAKRLWWGRLATPRSLTLGDTFALPNGAVVAYLP